MYKNLTSALRDIAMNEALKIAESQLDAYFAQEDQLIEMSDAQMDKREDIVKSMKKDIAGFKKRYGDRWKEVMYATATKQAMGEEHVTEDALDEYNYHSPLDRSYRQRAGDENHARDEKVIKKYGSYAAYAKAKKSGSSSSATKHFHSVPYDKREHAKAEGMKWDKGEKKWYHTDAGKSATSKFPKHKSVSEEVELDEEFNHRHAAQQGVMHPDFAKHMKKGHLVDFYDHEGNKKEGTVSKNDSKVVHIKHGGELHKFRVSTGYAKMNEEEQIDESKLAATLAANAKDNANKTAVANGSRVKTHRISVTLSEPNSPWKKEKIIRVKSSSPTNAVSAAKSHYKSKGYKVHDAFHHSTLDEEEQIDELSKATLGSYIRKAHTSAGHAISARQFHDPVKSPESRASWEKMVKKENKRAAGINNAVRKLTREELEEMSNEDVHALIGVMETLDTESRALLVKTISERSEQSKLNKRKKNMLDTMRGLKYRKTSGVDHQPDDYGYKSQQHLNKAIGRGLRNEEVEILDEEHSTKEAAEKRMEELKKKHPDTQHSVVQGRRSGKWFVMRHTRGGSHVVEAKDETCMSANGTVKIDDDGKKTTVKRVLKDPDQFSISKGSK